MKARPSDSVFEATNGFTCVAARGLAHHPRDGFVDRLQKLSFLPSCYPSYGLLTFGPMGLPPTEYASLRWTHISSPFPTFISGRCTVSSLSNMLAGAFCTSTLRSIQQAIGSYNNYAKHFRCRVL